MCAIAGAVNVPNAAEVVSIMLKAQQNRGQEAAGIVSCQEGRFHEVRNMGLVDEVFRGVRYEERLPGDKAVGHLRYATTGGSACRESIQPLTAPLRRGKTAIVHNGNIPNYHAMREELERAGSIFRAETDTELILHLYARSSAETPTARLQATLPQVEGAFSILLLTPGSVIAATDPFGFRPLATARYGQGWVFASETRAFDVLQATEPASIEAGEIVEVTSEGKRDVVRYATRAYRRHCSFEHIYFTMPDSVIWDEQVTPIRERIGAALARSAPADADLVSGVPDSSIVQAHAYAEALGLPYRGALVRNKYMGRTFITPDQTARVAGVRMKFNADRHVVRGKRIALVDDSIVRGTTMRKVVEVLRGAGAKEVHLRIASPPFVHPCFWGIDTPDEDELVAARMTVPDLARHLGVDSLAYLSVTGLEEALHDPESKRFCTTCFTRVPPVHDQPISLRLSR